MLLKKAPPKGKRLLVICTTSRREVGGHTFYKTFYLFSTHKKDLYFAQFLGFGPDGDAVSLHRCPARGQPEHWSPPDQHHQAGQTLSLPLISTNICHVHLLLQSDAFTKEDIAKLASKLSGRKACIGVKKLLGLIDMVKQTDPR